MRREEVFENRKEIVKILCNDIRKNGYMGNAIYFIKRPYHDGENQKKFSGANYLRLLSSRNFFTVAEASLSTMPSDNLLK